MPRAKKLPSGNWRVNQYVGRDENGKRIYKSFTASTKRAAECAAAQYMTEHRTARGRITVGEAIDRYIECKSEVLSPTTIQAYKSMRKFHLQGITDKYVDSLTREDVQKEINREAIYNKPKTVSNIHGLLAAAITMQDPNFVLRTTLPRNAKKLKRDLPTAKDVVMAVKGSSVETQVLLAMCLCLRMSEVLGVRKSAVDGDLLRIDRVVVYVGGRRVEKDLAKTDATIRYVKLPAFLKQMILESEDDYLIRISSRALYGRFTKLMKKAGFHGVRFHDLRHIAASDMHRLGVSDRVAAERGGWSGTQTMKSVYQHSFSEDRREADRIICEYYEKIVTEQSSTDTFEVSTGHET